ncbi:MAG TPA: (Fe-S)-binding protein [Stellaceae bacterium]|nr:(Fe-S)-binding protein [Stellaceae bacterium]
MDPILDYFAATAEASMARCTSCGKCLEACPTAAEIGLDKGAASAITGELARLTAGAGDAPLATQWVEACNGSAQCTAACPEGINVRQWVSIERMRQRVVRAPAAARTAAASRRFRNMSHSVRLLAGMQVPSAALARVMAHRRERTADFVFYTGCNVLRTPHMVFNVMDILDALGVAYEVMGGPGHCCGVYQFHEGDLGAYGRIAGHTYDSFAKVGAKRVLSWCPSCTKQFGEMYHDYAKPNFDFGHIAMFLVEQLPRLREKFATGLPPQRVAIHEHDGIEGVSASVRTLVAALPHVEIVEIAQDRGFGYVCGGPAARHPEREREVHRTVAENAAAAGVDTLVTIYHSCHRQLSGAEAHYPFAVKNFTDLIAEAIGAGGRHDYYKQYKRGGEMDEALAAARVYLETNGITLDAATVEALSAEIFGETGIAGSREPFARGLAQHVTSP